MSFDYLTVTEIAGDEITREQLDRHARRYYWAGDYCRGKDVLEVACGTGAGAGYIASLAKSLSVGDNSAPLLSYARKHYGNRINFQQFDAQTLPFDDGSFDVVLICEALYYLPSADAFFKECRRVLRATGTLLIVSANKDLFDFNPSPHSTVYFGVVELADALGRHGFATQFFGDSPLEAVSSWQRLLRPAKALAARLNLIPKSMDGKKFLKRLVFGRLVPMPPEITETTAPRLAPTPLPAGRPDRAHKVILCAATVRG